MDYGDFQDDVPRIRKALIPRIIDKELRGYVILPKQWRPTSPTVVHSHWNLLKNGKYRSPEGKTYLDEIEEELTSSGLVKPVSSISVRMASRSTLYSWSKKWGRLPDHLMAYDKNGKIIPRSEIKSYIGPMVVEGMEQDMRIHVESTSDMKDVLNIFKARGHKFKIDNDWDFPDGKRELSQNCFHFADDIPLIAMFSETAERGFDAVSYTYVIQGRSEMGSYAPLNSLSATRSFAELDFVPETETRQVNRVFSKFIAGAYQ